MIHNDKSHGSLLTFSNDQLAVLNLICHSAERNMSRTMPEPTMPYRLHKALSLTNVWLVPETAFIAHMHSWCEGAREVYDEWYRLLTEEPEEKTYESETDAECIDPLDIQPATPLDDVKGLEEIKNSELYEESGHKHMTPEEIAKSVLEPWSNCFNKNAQDVFVKYFPLGWFDGKEIYICLDLISKHCGNDSAKALKMSVTVLLHELAHAMMHNDKCGPGVINKTPYLYWAEEAMANKIMLNYLSAYDTQYFMYALDFVMSQAMPYKLGIALFKNQVGDYAVFRKQKALSDLKDGIKFLKLMCQLQFRGTFTEELNRTFYRMMNVYSLLDDWTGKRIEGDGELEYNDGIKTTRVVIGSWNDAYLRLVQILQRRFSTQMLGKSLPKIGAGRSSRLFRIPKEPGEFDPRKYLGPARDEMEELIIDKHGSASKMQERIKYVLDKMCIPYSNVRVYTKR